MCLQANCAVRTFDSITLAIVHQLDGYGNQRHNILMKSWRLDGGGKPFRHEAPRRGQKSLKFPAVHGSFLDRHCGVRAMTTVLD